MQPKPAAEVSCRSCCKREMAPPRVYPDGPVGADLELGADLDKIGCLYHDKEINLVNACFYEGRGANMLYLGEGTQMQFTTAPEDLNSELMVFRFRKYPLIEGASRDEAGRVTYQSRGRCIREGDNLTMDNLAVGRVLTHSGYVNPYNTPFLNVPYRDAIGNFDYMGTKSYENIRIISDDFDPSLPHNDQPIVRVDGSKRYYIQFTRTSQFLSLVLGQSPAPCLVKISGYMGPSTAFAILPTQFAMDSRLESQKQKAIAEQAKADAARLAAEAAQKAAAE